MRQRHLRNGTRTLLLTLVFAAAAVNVSQSLVLCLGCDGHVAIEPAGHYCCGAENPRVPDSAEPHSHIADDHCRPCTDIPIPLWTPDTSDGSPVVKAAARMPAMILSLLHRADGVSILPEPLGWPPPDSYHTPLSSIVLQV